MRNSLLLLLGTALLATTLQSVSAHERRHARKVERAPTPILRTPMPQPWRGSNAYYRPAQPIVPDWYRYAEGGAISAPAGR